MSRPIPIEEMVKQFKSRHTTSHLLKIDNFSLLQKYHIRKVKSSVFDLGGHKWRLGVVLPKGLKNQSGHLTILLERQASINVNLEFELFLVSQLERTWNSGGKQLFSTSTTIKGMETTFLTSLADLETKGYMIGDCCMFGVKFHGIEPAESGIAECFSLIEKPINHKVTWMMTKFSSFEPEKVHHSNEFVVGNRKWRIQVHPRGFNGEKDKSFSVYLVGEGFINNGPKTTFAKYKLRVLDQVNRNHVEKKNSTLHAQPGDHHGFADFMPLEKLVEPYLMNDKLYVGVEFEVISVANYC